MARYDIQGWIENAERGISENKPNFVLASSKGLKDLDRPDLAEKILKDALELYPDNVSYFRELSAIITERDPNEGLEFAEKHIESLGIHALFQKANSLSKLKKNIDAINIIEKILDEHDEAKNDRWIVSKLASLYIQEDMLDKAKNFLEPLIDSGVYQDVRMKQILSTVLIKLRNSLPKVYELLKDDVDPHSSNLKRKAKEIELIEDIQNPPSYPKPDINNSNELSKSVFLVHGHNNEAKETVARFLERLQLDVVILHEQPSLGKTIIEKFESHAGVGYAIALLTDDDLGKSKKEEELNPRARQNVIFEFGYFIGALGRHNVCALKSPNVEEPSDISGVIYIPLDEKGAWRLQLANEIKASGIELDMNLAF